MCCVEHAVPSYLLEEDERKEKGVPLFPTKTNNNIPKYAKRRKKPFTSSSSKTNTKISTTLLKNEYGKHSYTKNKENVISSNIDNNNNNIQKVRKSGWENSTRKSQTWIKVYLVLYNTILAVGWTYVVFGIVNTLLDNTLISWRWGRDGGEGMESYSPWKPIYAKYGSTVRILTLLVFLDVTHLFLKFVPPSSVNTILLLHCKVGRRAHIFLIALQFIPEVHEHWAVGFMFLHWGILDLIRYPFYALTILRICPGWLRWLRYSEFIVIYPIGFLSEIYLWFIMLPFIYNNNIHALSSLWNIPFVQLGGHEYFYFVVLYLTWRILSFPNNYLRMLRLRGRKKVSTK